MVEVTVSAKIPFEMDTRLRKLKKQTGMNIDRLVYEAILSYLNEAEKGNVGSIPLRRDER